MVMFQATDDAFTEAAGQNSFCTHARLCEKVVLPDSKHELLFNRDQVRAAVMSQIIAFFAAP
jgi:lysophospholipase